MWEWLMTKTTEIVKSKYKDNNIRSYQRDDVIQEIMMYLFNDKPLAEKIYKEKSVGLLYRISKSVMFGLKSEGRFSNKKMYSKYMCVQRMCEKYNISPIPDNAYKVAAVIVNDDEISDAMKTDLNGICTIKKLLEIDDAVECRLIEN